MGSGKTTLGARLAALRDAAFVDLDARLEAATGRSVRDWFVHHGEAAFRAAELATLRAVVTHAAPRCVLATGGGLVETADATDLLRQFGTVVWLRADPAACVARLGGARAARPLLDDAPAWRARWERRAPLYAGLAAAVVDTHPQTIDASLAALLALYDAPAGAAS